MAVKWARALFTNGHLPIYATVVLTELIADIDAHLAWRATVNKPLAESTFGLRAVNDGKLVERLRAGSQITVAKMDSIRTWIATDRAEAERGPAKRPNEHGAAA